METGRIQVMVLVLFFCSFFAQAEDGEGILEMDQQLEKLGMINYHPNLLPVILENSDFMDLTPHLPALQVIVPMLSAPLILLLKPRGLPWAGATAVTMTLR